MMTDGQMVGLYRSTIRWQLRIAQLVCQLAKAAVAEVRKTMSLTHEVRVTSSVYGAAQMFLYKILARFRIAVWQLVSIWI